MVVNPSLWGGEAWRIKNKPMVESIWNSFQVWTGPSQLKVERYEAPFMHAQRVSIIEKESLTHHFVGKKNMCHFPFSSYMGVSKNNGTPKSSILIGTSIIFTIRFGGKTPYFWFNIHIIGLNKQKPIGREDGDHGIKSGSWTESAAVDSGPGSKAGRNTRRGGGFSPWFSGIFEKQAHHHGWFFGWIPAKSFFTSFAIGFLAIIHVGVSKKWGYLKNGWFIMENPIKTDDLGYISIYIYTQ